MPAREPPRPPDGRRAGSAAGAMISCVVSPSSSAYGNTVRASGAGGDTMNTTNLMKNVRYAALAVAALVATDAAAQPWVYAPAAQPGAPAPAVVVGGLYSAVAPPTLSPTGQVIFRADVTGGTAPACPGNCQAIFRATADVAPLAEEFA